MRLKAPTGEREKDAAARRPQKKREKPLCIHYLFTLQGVKSQAPSLCTRTFLLGFSERSLLQSFFPGGANWSLSILLRQEITSC
jgi:hypothetical protein